MRPTALAALLALFAAGAPATAAPGTWEGALPCADCAAPRHRLQLLAGGSYILDLTDRQPRGGPDRLLRETGSWQTRPDGQIELIGGPEHRRFAQLPDGRLRLLDRHGKPIASRLYRPLTPSPQPDTLQTGIVVHLADAGLITRCGDGRRLPVAQAGASLALEQAYLAHREQAGAPLAVSLVGHLETLPGPDGGSAEMLVVDRVDRPLPGQGCPGAPQLSTMRWSLESLPGSEAAIPSGPRTPWLQFDPTQRRLLGATGCNRLSGEYRSWGAAGLSLLSLATTRMACPASDVESAFLHALSRATHRIQAGNRLDLLADGVPVARFIAR